MAQRRMFSIKIINSARFLRMPIDSQNLYFHLGLHADDDGIVEAYPILKMLGSADDNLRVLVSKGFIKVLNDDLVSYILDWSEHNLIRPDRKIDSIYRNLLLQVIPDAEIVDPKPRADTGKITAGRTMDGQWTAQVRIGKGSIGKEEKKKENIYSPKKEKKKNTKPNNNLQPAAAGDLKTPETEEAIKLAEQEKILGNQVNKIFSIFHDIMNPTINFGNKTQRKAAEELISLIGYKPTEDLATAAASVFYEEYAPKIKNPLELKEKLPNLMAFINNRDAKKVTIVDRDSETQPEQYI